MSDQLERYFAAALGCAITAMWATAGVGPALACLAVAAASYGAAALVQLGALRKLLKGSTSAGSRLAAAQTRQRAQRAERAEASARRPMGTARRPPDRPRAAPRFERAPDPVEPMLSRSGPYGW
jgi:hypothetical protein